MIRNRMRAFVLSTAFAILGFTVPATAWPFDGSWRMVLVTTSGHCGVINIGVASTAATSPRQAGSSWRTRLR